MIAHGVRSNGASVEALCPRGRAGQGGVPCPPSAADRSSRNPGAARRIAAEGCTGKFEFGSAAVGTGVLGPCRAVE